MTTYEVIQAIKLVLDKYSTSTSAVIGPAFLDEEICAFANQAMVEIICNKFTGNNQLRLGFELSVKRISDLERLIRSNVDELEHELSNVYVLSEAVDSNYLFLVSATVLASIDGNNWDNADLYPAEFVDRRTASKFLKTALNYPWIPVPKIVTAQKENSDEDLVSKSLKVYLDPDSISKYKSFRIETEWVVQPSGLDEYEPDEDAFGGVFSDAVLYEIINRAALLMLDNIESQRTQIKAELNKLQE